MDGKINIGVVGMGKMGILHTGILSSLDGIEVRAVADKQDIILSFIRGTIPSIKTYRDYNEMMKKEDLDLIYIATSTSLHTEMAKDCVDRGMPFFVEKPLGTSVDDCMHLIDLLLWFFGDVALVKGNVKSYYSRDVEDFVHSYLLFESGLEGYLDTSWSVRNHRLPDIRIEVQGENGMLIATDDYVKIYLDRESSWTTYYKQDLYKGVDIDLGGPEYTCEDKHLIESIRNNRRTEIDVSDGFKVQKVIEAIYKSASVKHAV